MEVILDKTAHEAEAGEVPPLSEGVFCTPLSNSYSWLTVSLVFSDKHLLLLSIPQFIQFSYM